MAATPTVAMADGITHPLIGFGTYKVGFVPGSASSSAATDISDPKQVIKDAVDVGYRHFDCAEFYGNEAMVGAALKEAGVPRKELFLVSKCWNDTIYEGKAAVLAQVDKTLKDLQTDYIDLYLVHWPVPGKHVEAYLALEEAQKAGKVRSIGISNYTIEDYEELKPLVSVKPVVNQIEINPFLYRKNTIEYFKGEGILMEAYRALRQGTAMDNAELVALAEKHGRSPSQILGRWCVQNGFSLIAKSAHKERMIQNYQVADFELDDSDMAVLSKMTTEENIEKYKGLYEKCIVRDTPLAETKEGIKAKYTVD